MQDDAASCWLTALLVVTATASTRIPHRKAAPTPATMSTIRMSAPDPDSRLGSESQE